MSSTCTTCRIVRQTTISTTQRRHRQHYQPYTHQTTACHSKNDLFYRNNVNNDAIYNNIKKFYSTNNNRSTVSSLSTVARASSSSVNSDQEHLKSIASLLLGTAFITSSAILEYDNAIHADSVMASSIGVSTPSPSFTKNKKERNIINEENNSTTKEETYTVDKVATSTQSKTNNKPKSSNNGIQMKPNPRKYNVSIRALRGGRLYMEDEYYVSEDGHFAGVFDGHGGDGVSSYLKDNLYNTLQRTLQNGTLCDDAQKQYWDEDDTLDDDDDDDLLDENRLSILRYSNAIKSSLLQIDEQVLSKQSLENQGSTAVAIYVHENESTNQRTILSANVGDSRAILSRRKKAIDLTRDHKPNEEKERNRILAMGETIEWDPFSHVYRVRNLSLSRAIGDKFAKPAISGEAEMKIFPLWEGEDEFVVLASDGLWDVMNSQDVVNFVHRRLNAPYRPRKKNNDGAPVDLQKVYEERKRLMSRYVAHEALLRGSADNICVVIVWLKDTKL